jgi:flavin reductase (DIM6/NTAB) family NADH-FMN oxidoreductase RutF
VAIKQYSTYLDITPVTAESYRSAISGLPKGITVITTPGEKSPMGCTATAVASLSLDPPTLLVSLASTSSTLAAILSSGVFAVNVLAWADRQLAERFATGTPEERFAATAWGAVDGVPVLTNCPTRILCCVSEAVELLDHTLVAGTAVGAQNGDAAPAVLYKHRQYAAGPV